MTLEESDEPGVTVTFVEGMVVENGWLSPYMVRDQHRMETVFENPLVFMTNKPLKHPNELMPILDAAMREGPRPLVILAENAEASALGMLVHNTQHRTLEAVAVRAPGFGHRRHPAPRRRRRVLRRHGDRRGGRAVAERRRAGALRHAPGGSS